MRAPFLLSALACFASQSAFANDLIILKNGDRFSGTIVGLSSGLVQIQSPHSDQPLSIVSDELENLSFEEVETIEAPAHSHQVNLRNGNVIPGEVTGLDAQNLQFKTWFAGPLSIPRSQIKSVFYGVTPQRLLYQGPDNLEEWDPDEPWEFRDGSLTSNSQSSIAQNLDLPDRFILRFHLSWPNSPSIRIHFCTDADEGKENHDGYSLYFSSRGATLQRALPPSTDEDKPQIQILGGSSKSTSDFKGRQTTVELRVDRITRRIMLYLDGELQGNFLDPNPAPAGKKVIFESQSSVRGQITLSEIKLHEWDAVTQRLRVEPRQDEESDTLTTDEGDRYSGQILERFESGENSSFKVKSPLLEQIVTIPEKCSAILYFAEGTLPKDSKSSYKLSLASGGEIDLSEIQLTKKSLTGKHPWLGKLTIDRQVVEKISRINEEKKTVSEEAPKADDPKALKGAQQLRLQIEAN
jgi:hypothetical protein